MTSYNRNFAGRNDENPGTHSFVASPEIVVALSLSGQLSFNPITDSLISKDGIPVKLSPPRGNELPSKGFLQGESGYIAPAIDPSEAEVLVDKNSDRLHLLTPFQSWEGSDIEDLYVLAKIQGKCTTDHISPAGKWLKFRGHLNNISDNMFIGAMNAFREEIGKGINLINQKIESFAQIARNYKASKIEWVVIGDENYGEGSSREHAAMEPRFLGGRAIIVKSFARIHETNLKKQGMLALTFANPSDYDKIREDDKLDIVGLISFTPGEPLMLILHHSDGTREECMLNHSYNKNQIDWFKAGSALNLIASRQK